MRKQTVFALAAIAAALLIFIVVYEQHTLSSGEIEDRSGQVLQRFVRSRTHGIRIERGGVLIVDLERDTAAAETLDTFDVGRWRLTAPVQAAADTSAVDAILSACEALSARRSLEAPSDADRAAFGLDEPRLVLTLRVADETQVVRIGRDDEQLGGTYVEVQGSGRVDVVGRDFFEALDQSTDHFRSRALFDDLVQRDVTAMTLAATDEAGARFEARLALREHRWYASAPFEGWARASTIKGILDALIDARASRFLADGGEALLADPRARITLSVRGRDPEGRDTGRIDSIEVTIFAACPAAHGAAADAPASEDEAPSDPSRAVRVGEGPIVCVPSSQLEAVFRAEPRLRELRLVSVDADHIERFLFATPSGRSEQVSLELRREGERWQLREPNVEPAAADDEAVSTYLSALRALDAESFAPADAATLASRGLDRPRLRLRFHHTDGETIEYVDVGASDTVGVWVRRGDEPSIARYPLTIEELLTATPLRFRSRAVLAREADDVVGLSITRGAVEERIASEDGAWRVVAPLTAPADRVATRELIRALVTLRAARWVGAHEEPAYGLARPSLRVHIELREPRDEAGGSESAGASTPPADARTAIDLEVGGETDGGAFARIVGERDVFVLPEETLEALRRPLLDRELVALDTTNATSVRLTLDGVVSEIAQRDGVWVHGDVPAAPDATSAFLERLRSLRARSVVSYGHEPAFEPQLVLEVRSGDEVRSLAVGAIEGAQESASALARVSGLDATFRLSADSVRAMASYRP